MRNESCLVATVGSDRNLPITAIVIESRKDCRATEGIETIIHGLDVVRVGQIDCVEASEVDTES